ncbi:mitochondrial E3 ubiquitin protein ligase 1-like isoform X1 [Lycorma delicatula]|uniref:mitochondrial E3 ubiquitin protein ligase 1-like isoform X1 n=1 Tax=Lycorma delicatula TaxID=130591 RepID=UPI003F515F55
MDFCTEIFCISIDAILFGISFSQYTFFCKTLSRLKNAKYLGTDPELDKLTEEDKENAVIKGSVIALTNDLVHSFHSPQSKGVIQKITVTEHNISKNATGFCDFDFSFSIDQLLSLFLQAYQTMSLDWSCPLFLNFMSDSKHLVQEVTNTVPFGLKQDKYVVEVVDVRDCYILDLETVAAKFEPTRLGTLDSIIGFFNGVRQRGIETTEEMLKEGTILTGIGELTVVNGVKTLGPPSDGSGYILTVTPVSSIIKRLKGEQATMRLLLFLFGTIGIVLFGLMVRRGYKYYVYKMNEIERKKRLEEIRRERRTAARDNEELREEQRCVVCRNNPREIILLPCGHLCLCEDCSDNISNKCPICRASISSKAAVFL